MASCELCGLTDGRSKSDLYRAGWDWFTGWLPRTIYVCPTCVKSRPSDHKMLVAQSQSEKAEAKFYVRHPKMKRRSKGGCQWTNLMSRRERFTAIPSPLGQA